MKKLTGLLVFCLMATLPSWAQISYAPGFLRTQTMANGVVQEIFAPNTGAEGNVYLYDDWVVGTLYLFTDHVLENYPMKYDMEYERFEIKYKGEIKVLGANKVRIAAFEGPESSDPTYYVNGSLFHTPEGVPMTGFFKVLNEGAINGLVRVRLEVIKANYNPALDVGSRNDRYVRKEELYLSKDYTVTKLPGAKKAFLAYFGSQSAVVKSYMKENGARHTRKEGLTEILEFVHSLEKT